MYFKLTEHKGIEVNGYFWHPFERICFQKSLDISFKGDHAPQIYFYFAFICIGFDINFYDNRHEDERND